VGARDRPRGPLPRPPPAAARRSTALGHMVACATVRGAVNCGREAPVRACSAHPRGERGARRRRGGKPPLRPSPGPFSRRLTRRPPPRRLPARAPASCAACWRAPTAKGEPARLATRSIHTPKPSSGRARAFHLHKMVLESLPPEFASGLAPPERRGDSAEAVAATRPRLYTERRAAKKQKLEKAFAE
jgi:hypothetical protein